ncbi:penicillin-binding protein 1A [Pseudomarimonas salicorniae]|uniref:Penicillin-binding protein 1A n=1 Tax=Pseudomarimonas salicorniae TaxID=2933270 RepID=A0ABT0GJG2_9GAMM|nr:penicillin-binding protein 1A [Lysobacter sp. CAU 1642]MCK7594553.1 penicillin-binding protein 1A [Lysobacter sp. CAU 1642]
MPKFRRLLRLALVLFLLAAVMGVTTLGVLYWLIEPTLPSVQALRDVRLQVPLSVYSRDGKLLAQFGETRRYPVALADVPPVVRDAFIAVEDARFYEHPGVDWRGVTRAVWLLATSDRARVPGGSTITQQVAKMFFLSNEYSYTRKLTEMFLALKMERELSKDEILELYLNKSFFGNRAYGVVAAAEFYYGKTLDQLTLGEAAMLASIPKFPSSGNPIVNPSRALIRRNYVIERMLEEGLVGAAEARAAQQAPDLASPHEPPTELDAPWVAEMVRVDAIERFGDQALIDGFRVFTTLDSRAQEAANKATRDALMTYDRRHGWRGVEARLTPIPAEQTEQWREALRGYRTISGLLPALVLRSDESSATLGLGDGQQVELDLERIAWTREYLDESRRGEAPRKVNDRLNPGDVVRLYLDDEGVWQLGQIPKAQGTLTALDWETGAVRALTGGFSFALNKFNRAVQAQRLPGSSFKPFIYAAAFERGFTPATMVLDAPVVFNDRGAGKTWSPQNDNEEFAGPMRLREAMVTSRNLVSVRVLDAIGVGYARRFVQNFGFPPESLPENLSMALGTNAAPPILMARGYAAFVNGGFRVEPHFIERIEDRDGEVVFEATPTRACARCPERTGAAGGLGDSEGFDLSSAAPPAAVSEQAATPEAAAEQGPVALAERAVDERTAYLVHSLLRDVVRRGTGSKARVLGRQDLGGKTGTTNEYRDGWFSGFGGPLAVTAWVGMDDFTSLGRREFASATALPMWIDFMKVALEGEPEHSVPLPEGLTTAMIDRDTGLLTTPGDPDAIAEVFRVEDIARLEQRAARAESEQEKESFDIF